MNEVLDEQARSTYQLTEKERRLVSILLIESDNRLRNSMRQALVSLGYEDIADSNDHVAALEKLEDRLFSHVIFDTKQSSINPKEFLALLFQKADASIAIASSTEPTVDEVFDLLIGGARGYIVKPFTAGSLDEAIVWSTKGESISEAVLEAESRNEALALLTLSSLDKLALVMRQARKFDTAKREVPRRFAMLKRALEISKTFSKGGIVQFQRTIIEAAIKKASRVENNQIGPVKKRRRRTVDLDKVAIAQAQTSVNK